VSEAAGREGGERRAAPSPPAAPLGRRTGPLAVARRRVHRIRRHRRLRQAAPRLHGGPPDPPAPFICGATRSGTTLLRLMLDAHPEVAIPSETHFVPDVIARSVKAPVSAEELTAIITGHRRWGDFGLDAAELGERIAALEPLNAADAIRVFFRLYAEVHGKRRWGDKTPGYIRKTRQIQRILPEARFIHTIRDGRDVALSLMPLDFGPSTITEAAELWKKRAGSARRHSRGVRHYTEIFYEDLVLDTERTLRGVCEYLDLPWDAAMLDYHESAEERLAEKARDLDKGEGRTHPAEARIRSHALATEPPRADRVARWKREMSPDDVAEYERVAGDLLAELGYELASR
jgi:hypothetical protein